MLRKPSRSMKAPSSRRFSTPGRIKPGHAVMNIQPIPLRPGQKYTVYSISDGAMTRRQEITVTSVLEDPVFRPAHSHATRGRHRLGTFRTLRKRGEFHLEVNVEGALVIPGWGHLQADHEAYDSFAVSATMNLAEPPGAVRELVARNINPNYCQHDRLIAYPLALNHQLPNGGGFLVFPETPTEHAVIAQMREVLGQKEGR